MRVSAVKSKRNLVEGRSFPLNIVLVVVHVILLFLTFDNFLTLNDATALSKFAYAALLLLTTVGLFILKGFYLYSYVARFCIAVFLLIAGFGKLNDPIGFSEILKLYFQDGALNLYLSDWFGWTDLSLEKHSLNSLNYAVFVGIVEVLLSLMLLFHMLYKMASWLVFVLMLMASLFSLYNFQCDANQTFEHQIAVVPNSVEAQNLYALSLIDYKVNLVSESSEQLIFSKVQQRVCILDSGRIGADHSVLFGWSLTHKLNLLIGLVGLVLSLIICVTQFQLLPNSPMENTVMALLAWVFILVHGILSSWFWLVFLSAIVLYLALNIRRFGIPLFRSFFSTILVIAALLFGLAYYVISYEPLTDFRAYSIGSDLSNSRLNANESDAQKVYVYRSKRTNRERFLNEEQHVLSGIWEDTNFVFLRMQELDFLLGFGSIEDGFNPLLEVQYFAQSEMHSESAKYSPLIQPIYEAHFEDLVETKDKRSNAILVYRKDDFPAAYEKDTNFIVRKYAGIPADLKVVNVADLLLKLDLVFLWVVKDTHLISDKDWSKFQELHDAFKQHEHHQAVLGNMPISEWGVSNKIDAPDLAYFLLNRNEQLKICRSNVCLLVLKDGRVAAKYPLRGLPKYETITSKLK